MSADAVHARYARVQEAMARAGVGALVLATPHLGAFASGARRVLVAGSGGTVPWVVIAAGAPAAVVLTTDPDGAPPWMPRAHVLPLRWDRGAQLDRIAAAVAATRGGVACDVPSPALRAALGAERPLVDAAPVLAAAAAPLSAAEVDALVRALGAARAAITAAAAAVRPGATATALRAAFAGAMAPSGAGFPLGEGRVWRAGAALVPLAPDDPVGGGDPIALEMGLWLAGHAGLAGDTVGAPAALGARWREAAAALAASCRAGATNAELSAAARAAGAEQAGLVAHGLGVGLWPPWVDLDDDDAVPLLAGSALVLAPVVREGGAAFRATATVLVGAGAPRRLDGPP
jgi:Xaa-Pro aminopeptidase